MKNEPTKPDHSHQDTPEWREHAERNITWFLNPEKKRIRRVAKREIKSQIDKIVVPLGFSPVTNGTGWEIEKRFVIRGIYVQPSRYGDCCFFNLTKKSKYKFMEVLGYRRANKRLRAFYTDDYDRVGDPGSLYYYDIEELPKYLDQAMEIITKRAVPWLLK